MVSVVVYINIYIPANPCISNNPCQNNGLCNGTSGTALCDCSGVDGYEGLHCASDINECHETTACENGGQCTNMDGSYRCTCTGLSYEGDRCEKCKHVPLLQESGNFQNEKLTFKILS